MLEVVTVGFLLSIITIINIKSGNNLGMLDPEGARLVSIYMLAIMLSLLHLIIKYGA